MMKKSFYKVTKPSGGTILAVSTNDDEVWSYDKGGNLFRLNPGLSEEYAFGAIERKPVSFEEISLREAKNLATKVEPLNAVTRALLSGDKLPVISGSEMLGAI
jgi:hypothetical protein